MVYTKKTPWPLIIGLIMVAFGYLVQAGVMEPMIKYFGTSKLTGEMIILSYVCGGIATGGGLWQLLATPSEGQGDYYLSTVGGLAFILLVAFVVKWVLDPQMAQSMLQAEMAELRVLKREAMLKQSSGRLVTTD